MAEPLIHAEGVRKKFCRSLSRALRYGASDLAREVAGLPRPVGVLRRDEFWAVRDVGFELHRGDSLGLIGPNGAGKTTLLRMLSGVIRPDGGRIAVRGRLQALVALGAGFNPILSGRENIYVNGAVLGIPKREIDRRIDEIIDFSGIREFIDAPVQSYSSGMIVRLGFSVAIHLEPDILLVDEVLAVGDLAFRARCSRKLGELKDRGIPWILVSHDLGTIRNQTNRVMVLDHGRCVFLGDPDEAVSAYLHSASQSAASGEAAAQAESLGPCAEVRITGVHLLDGKGAERASFETGERLDVRIDFEADERVERPEFGVAFYSGDGTCYAGINTAVSGFRIEHLERSGSVHFELPHLGFLPGVYRLRVDLHDRHIGILDSQGDAAVLRVDGGIFGIGLFSPEHAWRIENR